MFDSDQPIEIRQDKNMITVFWVTYVHSVGVGVRAMGLPSTSLTGWKAYLENEADIPQCEHQSGGIWIFQGIWPNELSKVFTHVSFDIHEVGQLLAKPGLIRIMGKSEVVTLLPVDPVTGDCTASVLDYNNWIEYHSGVSERADFSALQTKDVGDMVADIEALLRDVADSNRKQEDNE